MGRSGSTCTRFSQRIERRPARRAELVRERLIDGVRPVRSLLIALVRLPWQATDQHPVLQALRRLQDLYAHEQRYLPAGTQIFHGRVWQVVLAGTDRERAFCAFEVATLLTLRRALRNGTVWIDHSLAFRSRERLFIPADRWGCSAGPRDNADERAIVFEDCARASRMDHGYAIYDERRIAHGLAA